MTRFLTVEQILIIHDSQIENYKGSHGIRDLSLLESAAMRPQASFGGKHMYESVFNKASVLLQSIILNHPFVDGNKRTAVVSALTFLELNKIVIKASDESLIDIALKTALKEWDIRKISKWLKAHSKKV